MIYLFTILFIFGLFTLMMRDMEDSSWATARWRMKARTEYFHISDASLSSNFPGKDTEIGSTLFVWFLDEGELVNSYVAGNHLVNRGGKYEGS